MIRHSITAMMGIGTLASVLIVPLSFWSFGVQFPRPASRSESPPPSIAQIQSTSDLATTRVHITDVFEHANADYRGKWALHGELILGVDLSKAAYLQSLPEKRQAVLSLPAPHLISTKVDHERSEEIYVKATAWVPFTSRQALRDEVWKAADRHLQKLGQESGYMDRTRLQVEHVLDKLFSGADWKVTFQWREAPTAEPK